MSELKTPETWCAELGARVMDPDGWRDGTRSWDEPINRAEFDRRLVRCTIDARGYPQFWRPMTTNPPADRRRPLCDEREAAGRDE